MAAGTLLPVPLLAEPSMTLYPKCYKQECFTRSQFGTCILIRGLLASVPSMGRRRQKP
jgi:hypothetical protein